MVRKGIRKSKTTAKPSLKVIPETAPIIEPQEGMEKPKEAEQPSAKEGFPVPLSPWGQVTKEAYDSVPKAQMVNLRAKIHDVGMLTITVPANKVDKTLEKIWRTGFKQKLANNQRTHQVYGPHLIDRIDVEPII